MPVISSKPYIAGDVVFKFKPLVTRIRHNFRGKHCDNCLKLTDQLKKCSKCLQWYYCSKNCQTIDWSFHKNECKVFREKTITEFDSLCLPLLRLYLRIKSDKTFATERHTLFDGSDVCLNDIKVNVSAIDSYLIQLFDDFCHNFKTLGIDIKVAELFELFKLMFITTHKLERNTDNPIDYGESIAEAVCLQVWPISHSCLPNTAMIRKDEWMEIRAMKSIAIGEEITMASIELFNNYAKRQKTLKETLCVCNCDKCRLHLDKHIDYQEFNLMLDKETKHWNSSKLGILHAYEMDHKFIIYLEAIYGEFHPSVTHFLLESFMCFANSKKASDSLLTLWFKRIERHVLVTHGSDHPWYAMLRNTFDKSLKNTFNVKF